MLGMNGSRGGLLLTMGVIGVILIAFAWLVDLRAVAAQIRAASGSRLAAAAGMLLSVLAGACFWAFHALALTALPLHFTPRQVLTLSLGALALATPSAPTQPGLYHASVVAPLGVLGFGETSLTAYAVLLHAVMMACMLALGALGLALTRPPAAVPSPSGRGD
jgi:hypothetical protein